MLENIFHSNSKLPKKDLYYSAISVGSVEGALRKMVAEDEIKREGLEKSISHYMLNKTDLQTPPEILSTLKFRVKR